jgi:hypothetical protein
MFWFILSITIVIFFAIGICAILLVIGSSRVNEQIDKDEDG